MFRWVRLVDVVKHYRMERAKAFGNSSLAMGCDFLTENDGW